MKEFLCEKFLHVIRFLKEASQFSKSEFPHTQLPHIPFLGKTPSFAEHFLFSACGNQIGQPPILKS